MSTPMCVFPPCVLFAASVHSPGGRLCTNCGRPLSGRTFGPGYGFDAFLDSGYFADVFRARDLQSGLAYAAKIYGNTPPKRDAGNWETTALRELAHHRLPALKDSFEDAGWFFVIMDLVAGTSLRQDVETHGPLSVQCTVELGIDVAEVLEFIASRGWTYRDLHPRNIHLGTPKDTMLLDLDGSRPPGWPAQPAGRAGYCAPELATKRLVTAACDVYSLVGCLYFALLGDDPPAEPGPLPELRAALSLGADLADLLDASRQADPNERPGVGALQAALRHAVGR